MPANLLIGLSGWFPSSKPWYGLLDNVDPSKPKQFPLCWSHSSLHHLFKEIPVASCAEDSLFSFHPSFSDVRKGNDMWKSVHSIKKLLSDREIEFFFRIISSNRLSLDSSCQNQGCFYFKWKREWTRWIFQFEKGNKKKWEGFYALEIL